MRRGEEYYEQLDRLIYELLVIDPQMSLREMQNHLAENKMPVGDAFVFLSNRRKKVMRRMIAEASRMTKIINAAEYNTRVNSSLKELSKILHSKETPAGVKARAAEAITNISHKRLMTFTLLNIYMPDMVEGRENGEKQFPAETFDIIGKAFENNMFRQEAEPFKYLPDTPIDIKKNKEIVDVKPTEQRKFFTTIPIKGERAYTVPHK